jgi:2-polyprenyl-3-methyl-5-hydroxy-6-metoxy-1,4-benzoquinol methylase
MKLDFVPRACPLCGGEDASVMVEATVNEARLTASAFASRKLPEYMHSRMVECNSCGMLYANPVLRQETLSDAYKDASFDSGAESHLAAVTYRRLLEPHLTALPSRTSALDIGAGDGAFVEELLALGFADVVGVEPSIAPIEAAKPAIRGHLKRGIFAAEQFATESLDLVTCFQVIEHVWDPVKITSDALALLRPGGLFFIVAHNRRAFSARIMGTKSPIFDIEHLQLFDKPTSAALLRNAGFHSIEVSSVRNKYPVDYWIKLFPLPNPVKSVVRRFGETSGIGKLLLSLPAGNLAVIGQKPCIATRV